MEPNEILAEIERRRRQAIDLKLRETTWSLYRTHIKYFGEKIENDPELVLPEVRQTISASPALTEFLFGECRYRFTCVEGKTEEEENWSGDRETTTPITIGLVANGELVFEFSLKKTVTYTPDFPDFRERLGNITAFVEGPWVSAVAKMQEEFDAHAKAVREKRDAPRLRKQLENEMKKFGL
jgi:hypothetical protein